GRDLSELDLVSTSATLQRSAAEAREIAGDRAGAEQELEARLQLFEWTDHAIDVRTMIVAYQLAHFYCDDGRWDEAEGCLAYGREVPVPAYFLHEAVLGLAARGRLAAHRGELAEALALAQRGVELAELSDYLNVRACAWIALAE